MLVALKCLPCVLYCLLMPEKQISDLRLTRSHQWTPGTACLSEIVGRTFGVLSAGRESIVTHSVLMRPPDPSRNL